MKEDLVICPVYNEQETIREFYVSLRKCYSHDVLFVDDGSVDESHYFLSTAKDTHTFVQRHSQRRGYGAALMSGFNFALRNNYRRVVTLDVDLQHKPEHIPFFLKELLEWEVVLGSRYITIAKSLDIPRQRLAINRYVSKLIGALFSVEFTDPFCGFRGYRDSFLKRVNLTETGYSGGLDILLEMIRMDTSFREISVEAIYFKDVRKFLDGLDNPTTRLLYYLEVISRKRKEMVNEEKISLCKPAS
ncbi:MAG: glycosyltransferase family 2 protein [Candidatus Omnitrophota bacterium]|nr:MAG: glycosyltransferase family 2 protein [Candidatus Omnitrophota bacterium]